MTHVPDNHVYSSPYAHQLALTAVMMSYYCCCVPGGYHRRAHCSMFSIFGGNSRGYCGVLPCHMMFGISASVIGKIESGSFFFAIQSDLMNNGLFITNRVFWPLSDRNRFSSRYATLLAFVDGRCSCNSRSLYIDCYTLSLIHI